MKAVIALALLLLSGCLDITGPTSHEQVAWAKSPDGKTHAILIETNGGATTAFGYLVELHPAGHQGEKPVRVANLYRVENHCGYAVGLYWTDADTLEIQFDSAGSVSVENGVIVGGKEIEVVQRTGPMQAPAPCRPGAAHSPH